MLLAEQRRLLCEYGRRAAEAGLVIGTSGNLSVRVGELVAVTPGGIALDHLEPESCPVIDVEGHLVDGELRPSSETPMRLAVYAATGGRRCRSAGHGGITVGDDLPAAFEATRLLEWLCEVYVRARAVTEPRVLTAEELSAVALRALTPPRLPRREN